MKGTLPQRVRLGVFEVDLRAGELRQDEGAVLLLSDQPLQILRILIEADGEIVTRDEIRQRLWPNDTVVEFDHSINSAIKKLRRALVDSGDEPHYIGTIAKRGYRLLVPVERIGAEADGTAEPNQTAGASTRAEALGRDDTLETHASGKRSTAWKWLAPAAVACIAVVVAVPYWRTHRSPKLTERDTIVVADFDNKTGDPVFDDTLKQALTIQLEQSPFLNVLSDERVGDTLTLMNRQAGARLTREISHEVCLRSNSQAVLSGTIASIGDRYLIGLKAVNCQTGDTLASSEEEAENRNSVLQALSKAGTHLRGKLGESFASLQKFNQPLEQVTTSSLEALQAYTQGIRTSHEEGGDSAIPHFKRAVELDPNFAMAYAALGSSYGVLVENSMRDRNVAKAYELRYRVGLRERFNIESTYYWDVLGDLDQAVNTYTEWVQYYPYDYFPRLPLAKAYADLGQWEKSAVEAREAIQLMPNLESYVQLVKACLAMNRLEEAKGALREAEQHHIDGYLLRQQRYMLAFVQGDTASMKEQDTWAAGKPLVDAMQYTLNSSVEAYHGRFARARELMGEAEAGAARAGGKEIVGIMKILHGPGEAEIGNTNLALRSVADAWTPGSGQIEAVEPTAALTLALVGKEAEARKLVDKMNQESPRDTITQSYVDPSIRAAIELQSNNPSKAVELLKASAPYELADVDLPPNALYPAYLRGVAYLKAGHGQQAAAEFQRVIDHPGVVLLHLQGALAHLQLARAQAMAGDKAAARQSYQDFLTLWKDADPDIPIYQQAKAEYAKLQ